MSVDWPSEEAAAYWLGCFLDSEGHVTKPHDPRGLTIGVQITMTNTQWELIERCCSALDLLGIEFTRVVVKRPNPKWKSQWLVRVTRIASVERFASKVPVFSPVKRERIAVAINRSFFLRRPKEEELRRLYHDERMTQTEIARHFGVERNTVRYWMAAYSIPRRSKSEFVKLWKHKTA